MSHNRNTKYLDNKRIVYRRDPIEDKPTQENECYLFYEDGTYECYHLFNNKAKITTYKSLKWHLLVLWYLNPQLDQDEFQALFKYICNKRTGFITFTVNESLLYTMVYEVSMMDLDHPPRNKQRKIIFKEFCKLTTEEKLSIVGKMVGRSKTVHEDDIYQCMLDIHDMNKKITIANIAKLLDCSARTIHRNMGMDLKKEKELLNQEL